MAECSFDDFDDLLLEEQEMLNEIEEQEMLKELEDKGPKELEEEIKNQNLDGFFHLYLYFNLV